MDDAERGELLCLRGFVVNTGIRPGLRDRLTSLIDDELDGGAEWTDEERVQARLERIRRYRSEHPEASAREAVQSITAMREER